MQFVISAAADAPIYRQIMRQIMDAVAGERLAIGDRLPSHRELSEQLVIAPLTVKKAYDELEALGYVESYQGRGTFIAARPASKPTDASDTQLLFDARRFLSDAYFAGYVFADVVKLIKTADHGLTRAPAHSGRKDRS